MADEMGRLVREVIASYEARVASVEQIIEATYEMLEGFKSQREEIRTQLREALAKAASLRRRDFDVMMRQILSSQEEREAAVRQTVKAYLREQREMAMALRERLAKSESERIGDFRAMVAGIQARQMEAEREIKALLAEFQKEQEELVRALGGLLSNGGSIRVKEFKATLRTIQARRGDGRPVCVWARTGREEGERNDADEMRVLPGGRVRSL